MVSLSAYAQHAVVVNPDGTHSTAIHNGNSTTIVNPDGTHSVVINNGNSATKDNSKWKKWWTRKSKNWHTTREKRPFLQVMRLFSAHHPHPDNH